MKPQPDEAREWATLPATARRYADYIRARKPLGRFERQNVALVLESQAERIEVLERLAREGGALIAKLVPDSDVGSGHWLRVEQECDAHAAALTAAGVKEG